MSLIHYFESTDAGAPTLNNAAGSMIAVLDAVLITGYNSKSVTSITVASGVATVVCTAHGYANTYGKVVAISGATGSFTGLNANTRIANVTTNGFTFLCPGVADGVATGVLVAKYAPLGWVKQFTGTNKAMYKRSEVTATGCMLRVDDATAGQTARVLMVHSATDIDTYTNPCPTAVQIGDGLGQYWSKGSASATAARWFLVADSFIFYLFPQQAVSSLGYMPHGFGDVPSFKPADILNTVLLGPSVLANYAGAPLFGQSPSVAAFVIAGAANGVGISASQQINYRIQNYAVNDAAIYPSPVDGGLVIQYPILMFEGVNKDVRGLIPGIAIPQAKIDTALSAKTIISNIIGSSRSFLVVASHSSTQFATVDHVPLVDLTGPWR